MYIYIYIRIYVYMPQLDKVIASLRCEDVAYMFITYMYT